MTRRRDPKLTDRQRYTAALREQRNGKALEEQAPTPQRITMALDMRGLYGPEVDRACGVEEPAVDEWEAGTRIPTKAQVVALARLTDFAVSFFYQPEPVDIGPVIMCGTGGCEVVERDYPADPRAEVVPLFGQGTLPLRRS